MFWPAPLSARRALRRASLLILSQLIFTPPSFAHLSIIRQGAESTAGLERLDQTGGALAVGDFDNDGYDDLAIGAPNENVSGDDAAGAVIIVYGTKDGLTPASAESRTATGIGGTSQAGARFGHALASGYFNDDEFADLAIGAPLEDVTIGVTKYDDAGRVYILLGVAGGLSTSFQTSFSQQGVGGVEEFDEFGRALTAGDFDGDGDDDLAVGSPGEDTDAGAVFHYYSTAAGITSAGAGWMKQSTFGVGDAPADRFGVSLAAGNFCGTGTVRSDLAIGAPNRNGGIGFDDTGVIYIVEGTASGLSTAAGDFAIYAGSITPGGAQAGEHFGYALASGKFWPSTYHSLAISAPGRDVSGAGGAGRVVVARGMSSTGLSFASDSVEVVTQGTGSTPENGDGFGMSLATGDYDNDGDDDLTVGAPDENVNATDAGYAQVFLAFGSGAVSGFTASSLRSLTQERLQGQSEAFDNAGFAVAMGRFDNTERANVAVGCPREDTSDDIKYDESGVDSEFDDAGCVYIFAPWRQPSPLSCRNSAVLDCNNELVFSQRPFDRIRAASTNKVMTLLIACERIQDDVADSAALYTIPAWIADASGKINGTRWGLLEGERWKLIDLLRLTAVISANDAAFAVADALGECPGDWEGRDSDTCIGFVGDMNARRQEPDLEMTNTVFQNPAGRPWGDPYSTAAEMAKLFRVAMSSNSLFRQLVGTAVQTISWIPGGSNTATRQDLTYGTFTSLQRAEGRFADGVKPGNNSPSLWTRVFSSTEPGKSRVAGAAFGWPASTSPISADMDTVLGIGQSTCLFRTATEDESGEREDVALAPGAPTGSPPEFHLTAANLSTLSGALGGAGLEPSSLTDPFLQVDVVRQDGTGAGPVVLRARRSSEIRIPPGGIVNFGIAPFESHLPIQIDNGGTSTATLVVTSTHPPGQATVAIPPEGFFTLPPFGGPMAPNFHMSIENLSTANAAELSIQELGYDFVLSLAEPGQPGSSFSATIDRSSMPFEDNLVLETIGIDPNPGSRVYLAVHAPGPVVEVPDPPIVVGPARLQLLSVRPSPSRGAARIEFDLSRAGRVEVAIHDVRGRVVARLAEERFEAGRSSRVWDGRSSHGAPVATGLYFMRLILDGDDAASGRIAIVR
ncbi:MAG: FlgD immunoglobulin-like domain containing protein [Candidatus Eiseniibacteriota bacterium]